MRIDEFRQQYPEYDDMDDKTLSDSLYNKYYSDLEKNEFLLEFTGNPDGTELGRGIKRGLSTSTALVTEGAPGVAKGLLNDALNAFGLEDGFDPTENLAEYERKVQEAYAKNPSTVPSFRDITSFDENPVDFLKDTGAYIAGGVGEQVPQLGASLLSGGLGGLAGKQGIQYLAKKGGKELTKKQVDKAMTRGALAGTFGSSYSQTTPESYFNLLAKGEDEATTAILLGGLKSGLDTIAPMQILKKVMGKDASDIVARTWYNKMLQEGASAGAREGVTETAQTGLDLIAEQFILDNPDFFSEENITNLIDSGFKGAFGGAAIGAGASPLMNDAAPKISKKEKEAADRLLVEETINNVSKPEDFSFNPLEDSMIEPTYLSDTILNTAEQAGMQRESFVSLSPVQVDTVMDGIQTASENTRLNNVFTPTQLKGGKGKTLIPSLSIRQASILDPTKQRVDKEFLPGDGEIVAGAMVNDDVVTSNPYFQIKINNPQMLEGFTAERKPSSFSGKFNLPQNTSKMNVPARTEIPVPESVKQRNERVRANVTPTGPKGSLTPVEQTGQQRSEFKLPRDAIRMAPKYKSSPINFPSDVEKAIYTVGNRSKKSKADDKVMTYLEKLGFTPESIQEPFKQIKADLAKSYANLEDGETINAPMLNLGQYENDAKLQRTLQLPREGNLYDDYLNPVINANTLEQIQLTPKALKENKQLIQQMGRIVKEVFGDKVSFKPLESLTEVTSNLERNPAWGAFFNNAVHVVFNNNQNISETVYHEMYHAMEKLGMVSDKQRDILDRNTNKLLNFFSQDGYLEGQDFNVFTSTPTGREELRANAFGKMMSENLSKDPSLHPLFKRVFKQVMNFIERLRNAMKGLGFKSFDDVMYSLSEQKLSPSELMEDVNYNNATARLQRMASEFQTNHFNDRVDLDAFKEQVDTSVTEQNADFNQGKGMTWYGEFARSIKDLAQAMPIIAPLYETYVQKERQSSLNMHEFLAASGTYQDQPAAVQMKLHSLGAFLRSSNQKAKLDDQGRLVFRRGRKEVRINDTAVSEAYIGMQNAYTLVMEKHMAQVKQDTVGVFKEGTLPEDFTLQDVQQAIESATDTQTQEDLIRLEELMIGYEKMKQVDYVPALRFGNRGITVRNKETGEQVGLYTAELDGKFLDSFQTEDNIRRMKQKGYTDTDKYEVIGANGVIKDFSQVKDSDYFLLTKNDQSKNINPALISFENLAAMINSKDLDTDAYAQVKEGLKRDITERGFKKHFTEAKFLDGYSDDWLRVNHSYMSAAGHYLAGQKYDGALQIAKDGIARSLDPRLKRFAQKYIDYVGSPAEDMMALRTFNFLFTMGANISTAALQLMTLPTTTLAGMNQIHPNSLSNMKRIAKWGAIGAALFPMGFTNTREGIAHLDFTDMKIWEPLLKKGTVTQQDVDVFIRMDKEGTLRGMLTEESLGSRQFETRSGKGMFRNKAKTIANYLGIPITMMEQLSRFATTAAMNELMLTNPEAVRTAKKVYGNDPVFKARQALSPNTPFNQLVANFAMDEAHAVFGKLARPQMMRGIGGAMIIPFMTYPQQALEFMLNMMTNRGQEGRRGAYTALTALFLLSGLMGLPGGELLKETLERLQQQITGEEIDYHALIMEKMHEQTGSDVYGKFITQGIGRAFLDIDVARRIGMPIVGQDIFMNMLGIRGTSTDLMGVSGSFITGIGQGFNEALGGGSPMSVLGAITPVAGANLLKAISYGSEGVSTKKGVTLLTPEEVTARTRLLKAIGITSGEIADQRELQYFTMLKDTGHLTGINRIREKAKKIQTKLTRAYRNGAISEYRSLEDDKQDVIMEYVEYSKKNGLPVDTRVFMRAVVKASTQRVQGGIRMDQVSKHNRADVAKTRAYLGIDKE